MGTTFAQETADGPLLIADISGYTSFLQTVAVAHQDDAFAGGAVPEAYRLMSSLLDGIVGSVESVFTVSKLEGDAVFAFARTGSDLPHGRQLLECIRSCYAEFRARLAQVGGLWTCTCEACARASQLDLKFVLHAGHFVVQDIAGSRELSGPDVVMTHLLLKTNASQVVKSPAYALITQAAASRLDVPLDSAVPMTASFEHYAPVNAYVVPLAQRRP
jgi:hypothetical protein